MNPLPARTANNLHVEALYQAHQPWLKSWLLARLNHNADAADIAQDVFIRLLVKPVPTLDNAPKARAYLKVMARNLATDLWRRRELEQAWLETLTARPEEYAPSAEHLAGIIEALGALDAMLRNLPPKASRVFMLKMACEMTEPEIAAEIGISTRMVRKLYTQAMLHCMKHELGCDMGLTP
ncbi:sigma-70 family RNA polymerase sigma factor [Corticimicrobacter populi]|uniref:RNA polymerase subunit sigma n=1 Tax=Corticimicrobacter populi TaxID=2175229 RepID=A0A2V1JWE9_9BURK|nr:sigma-70 family RNA polymerase sigma factor [Corticimicrobacter populi]PWF22572.1 RNA polymerase subunit sigma [Corticimicrobacter populi]